MSVAHLTRDDRPSTLDLYYEFHGIEGGPPVLNIGGSGGDLRRTLPGLLPLNKHFNVLSYDQRGLGQSGRPDGGYTMADYADDAAAIIEHVGWERCHVMGTSFGGMVALNLAIRHPDLIDRMVLSCTSPGGAHPSYPLHHLRDMDPDTAFATRMRINDSRWDPDADEPIPGMGGYYDTMMNQARATPDPEVMVGLGKQLAARAGHDVEADVASISTETLVCAGRYDGTAPLPNSQQLAAALPGGRLAIFDGGHLFFLQDRTAFGAMIEFLQHGHTDPPEPANAANLVTGPADAPTPSVSTPTTSTSNQENH